MRTTYLGAYSVTDGFSGKRTVTHMVLDGHVILQVYPFGAHRSTLPILYGQVQDASEALWRIERQIADPRAYLRPA